MDLESDSFTRCLRHSSLIFTGFCSSCLAERLSNVGTAQQSLETACRTHSEIVEVPDVIIIDDQSKPEELTARRTLQYLFQLDDVHSNGPIVASQTAPSTAKVAECEISSSNGGNCSNNANAIANSCEGMVETDVTAIEEIKIGSYIAKEISETEDKRLKDHGVSFWFPSILTKRGFIWRRKSSSRMDELQSDTRSNGAGHKQLEYTQNLQHSCDLRTFKSSWDPPRHSWDGSMVSRALACSFTCLEEQENDIRMRRDWRGETMARKSNQTIGSVNTERVSSAPVAGEKHADGSIEALFIERLHEESQLEKPVSRLRGKRLHKLSKVWDWSITSSFRDLVKKGDHVLERSGSETCQGQKNNSAEIMESDGELHTICNSGASVRVDNYLCRRLYASNGSLKNPRPEWQMKSEFKLGRSRSVHYYSPGNLDNGLLRFYLTPLRRSRRCTNRGRAKNSHYFGRELQAWMVFHMFLDTHLLTRKYCVVMSVLRNFGNDVKKCLHKNVRLLTERVCCESQQERNLSQFYPK